MSKSTKTVADCQCDAVTLAGVVEAIVFLDNEVEGSQRNTIGALLRVAENLSNPLSDDLDRVETAMRAST